MQIDKTKGAQLFDLIRTNSFDHDGRLITVTAPVPSTGVSAPVTSYSWDSLSRLSSVTDPLGNITSYGHDSAGELTSVTAPVPATGVAAPVTTYAFDGLGREITVTDPLSGVTTFGHDANGNLISVKTQKGDRSIYSRGYGVANTNNWTCPLFFAGSRRRPTRTAG